MSLFCYIYFSCYIATSWLWMFWGSECLCDCAALICSWCVNHVLWTTERVNIRSAFITLRSLSFSQFTLVLIMFLLWACAAGASFEPRWPPQQQLCHSGLTRGSFERWPFCRRINPRWLDKRRAVTFDLPLAGVKRGRFWMSRRVVKCLTLKPC